VATNRIEGDLYVSGTVTPKLFTPPDGSIDNDAIASGDPIDADKLSNRHAQSYFQADGSDVAAAIVPIAVIRGTTGTLKSIEVSCVDAPSGGDKAFTVDLLVADETTPTPASVLSAPVSYSSTQSDCEVEAGTITSADLEVGDTLLVQVAVSGSTGTQGQGLVVTVTWDETPT